MPLSAPRVLFVTSEVTPWVKTGGLGDVSAALPQAVHAAGCDVRMLVPAYPAMRAALPDLVPVATLPPFAGLPGPATLHLAQGPNGLPFYLIDCPTAFGRPGNPYLSPDGIDWADNALRFGLLSHTAALLAGDATPLAWRPAVIHCNDWQAALTPAYLHYVPRGRGAKTLVNIHNLAYQGRYGQDMLAPLGLPPHAWQFNGVESWGALSFLKAGLQHADAITTVSPTYAREIQTAEGGCGLDALLRHRADVLTGIINGIDTTDWNPANDRHLSAPYQPYDRSHLSRKAHNTKALRADLGLDARPDMPLIGIISRLVGQKGLDLVPPLADALAALPVQLAVLGSGDHDIEDAFRAMAASYPGQFAVRIGFDEALSHRIEAGSDLFLMPSRFEPCGLNQMYSLHYATPPIVRATGGLADTVIDADDVVHGDGFIFQEPTAPALLDAIRRAVALWHDKPRFTALMKRGAAADFSWRKPAAAYVDVYRRLARLP